METDKVRVRIIAVPPGEAPSWVREKWVGLDLPLAQWFPRPSSRYVAGVLTGPRGFFARLALLLRGEAEEHSGFKVRVMEAIAVLEKTAPDAAQWWRANASHLIKPTRCFLFPEHVCKLVQ